MTLMPGVAQPYLVQAGGINNPARSMGVSVNGQPPGNRLPRGRRRGDEPVVPGPAVV